MPPRDDCEIASEKCRDRENPAPSLLSRKGRRAAAPSPLSSRWVGLTTLDPKGGQTLCKDLLDCLSRRGGDSAFEPSTTYRTQTASYAPKSGVAFLPPAGGTHLPPHSKDARQSRWVKPNQSSVKVRSNLSQTSQESPKSVMPQRVAFIWRPCGQTQSNLSPSGRKSRSPADSPCPQQVMCNGVKIVVKASQSESNLLPSLPAGPIPAKECPHVYPTPLAPISENRTKSHQIAVQNSVAALDGNGSIQGNSSQIKAHQAKIVFLRNEITSSPKHRFTTLMAAFSRPAPGCFAR